MHPRLSSESHSRIDSLPKYPPRVTTTTWKPRTGQLFSLGGSALFHFYPRSYSAPENLDGTWAITVPPPPPSSSPSLLHEVSSYSYSNGDRRKSRAPTKFHVGRHFLSTTVFPFIPEIFIFTFLPPKTLEAPRNEERYWLCLSLSFSPLSSSHNKFILHRIIIMSSRPTIPNVSRYGGKFHDG